MTQAPKPKDEAKRLATLRRLRILDTPPEGAFDRITLIAREMFGAPMAAVSLADDTRQWFKAKSGFNVVETPRDVAFCAHAIMGDGAFEVCDTRTDGRFRNNPLVSGDLAVGYYIAAPIITSDGARIGAVCVMDTVPRRAAAMERIAALLSLAVLAAELIEARFNALENHEATLSEARERERMEREAANISREAAVKHQAVLDIAAEARVVLDEAIRAAGERVGEAAAHARTLLQEAIDVAGIGLSGDTDRKTFEPARLLESIVTVSTHAARRRGVKFEMAHRLEGAVLEGDYGRLRHALLHFVSGVLSEALPGEATLAGALHPHDDGQLELRLEAIYQSGASPDHRLRLVSEADDDGASEQDFAICRRAVEALGGALWADRLVDGREARWISMPFTDKANATSSAPERRVLIADDTPANRRVLSAIVEAQGWRAVAVGNGFETIDMCMRERFDLILLDIRMPGMNGIETARCIRALGGWRANAPIVACTAETKAGLRAECITAGMDECIAKPVQPAPFTAMMRRLMDREEGAAPLLGPQLVVESAAF